MKRNLALFCVFVSLLIVTYFFQEKRVEDEYVQSELRDRLITEEVTHLKLPHVEALKKKGSWWEGGQLLSHNTFKQIEKKLSEIKKIKEIKGEWANFFPNPFRLDINHVQWTIGDLSLDKQGFYIAKEKKIYLAVIEGESTQLTQDETEIAGIKLNELVTFISKNKEELKETQLFRFYPDLPMERIVLSAEGALPFELNLVKNMTEPPPIPGVKVHKDIRGKFYSLLTQMSLKEEAPYSEKDKFKKLGELKFISSKKSVMWELWLKGKKTADALIIDPAAKRSFLMQGGSLKIFFILVQDYWDKKVIPQDSFVNFTRLESIFIQGNKKETVTILNREPLAFETRKFKVDQLKMELLIQFIFNLGPRDQAARVSLLSKSERQMLLSGNHLRIEVMNQELLLWRKQEELIVVNLTQGFKAHFNLLDESFNGSFEDVLK